MKKSISLNCCLNSTTKNESVAVSVPGTKKKLKRKSREPKRLFTALKTESMIRFPVDVSEIDCVGDTQMVNFSKLAPFHRPLMMSHDVKANSRDILSAKQDCSSPGHSGAIDMRVGINMSSVSPEVSQSPASPLSYHEISHWPISISQPLTNRLKLGLHSTLPLSEPASGSTSHGHQKFCWESSVPGQSVTVAVPSLDHMKTQVSEQKETTRKRVGVDVDTRARLPEVKAIQQTRRLLANARERTRVHTISAAFEALRKQVPCYSYGQKLSKLAILRIACNYILSLAHLAELDYSSDHSSVSFSQCVEQCTRTLQAEGRSKKRKE